VLRINEANELPDDLEGTVGVTAGASAPEALVQAVVERLAPRQGVEHRAVTTEEEYFPPPPELRELFRSLETALSLLAGAPTDDGTDGMATAALSADREVAAADVLAELEWGSADGPTDPIGARMDG
jgi:4-hydroxy-3-methylbut-2-enyl diphosphate reductase